MSLSFSLLELVLCFCYEGEPKGDWFTNRKNGLHSPFTMIVQMVKKGIKSLKNKEKIFVFELENLKRG